MTATATTSHWQTDARAEPSTNALPARCDVAVIGGGIAGVSTAYWLRQLDANLDVVIVERERLAHGASGRNAGFLLQGTDADFARTADERGPEAAWRLWQFTQENRDVLVDAVAGAGVGLAASGSFSVAGDEMEDDRLRRAADLLRARGVAVHYLSSEETNARLGSVGFFGALHVESGAMLHPVRTVRTLAERSGAQVVEGCSVERIESVDSGVRVVTDGGTLDAGHAVLALNAYLPQFVPDLARFVRPIRAQMLATAPLPHRLAAPVYSHEGYFYLRQLATGEVLLGGARHRHRAAEVGYDDATTAPLQADLEAYLRDHFPAFADAPVARRWSGTMGFSADGLPAFGAVPGVAGSLWVGGFTGHGMGYGFRMGRLVAATLLGQSDPFTDLFDAQRFGV
ncbi:MAG: FAD-binding oxidoreductase [Rhodothermales bacterium]